MSARPIPIAGSQPPWQTVACRLLPEEHALGQLTRGSLRISQKPRPPRPTPVLPRCSAPAQSEPSGRRLPHREGRCAFCKNHVPHDLRPSFPDAAHPPRASPAAGTCLGGRVVARFRKNHVPPTCARPSPVRRTRPERAQRQAPAPAGGSLRDFAKTTSPTTYARPSPMQRTRPVRAQRQAPASAGGSLRDFAKSTSPRPAPALPRGGAPGRRESGGRSLPRREGRCGISQKPSPPRLAMSRSLPRGQSGARPPLRRPGGRVVAQFRKNRAHRDLCRSFPGVVAPPGPDPAGGSLRNFAKKHVRGRQPPLPVTTSPQARRSPLWDRTTADAELRRCRRSARSAILPFRAPRVSKKKGNRKKRKQRKRNAPQRRWVGTSPRGARIIGVHRRSSAARILACLGKPPHRRQQRFAPPAGSCQGAHPRRRRELIPPPLTPPPPRRQPAKPASASPAAPPARYTYSQRTPAAPASSCSPSRSSSHPRGAFTAPLRSRALQVIGHPATSPATTILSLYICRSAAAPASPARAASPAASAAATRSISSFISASSISNRSSG